METEWVVYATSAIASFALRAPGRNRLMMVPGFLPCLLRKRT